MAFAPVMAGAGLLGSFLQSNSSKKAAQQNQSAESSIDNQIIGIYNNMMGKYNSVFNAVKPAQGLESATNFYQGEELSGLSPAVSGAANANFQQGNAQNLATLKDSLGPYTPNMAGMIKDFGESEITGNVSLQQQLAAMNQGVRQQGAAGLAGIDQGVLNYGAQVGESVTSGLSGLASGFGQAQQFNAQNAWANNPFTSLSNLALMYPNLFGGGSTTAPGQGGLGTTGGPPAGGGGSGGAGGTPPGA